MNIFKKIKEKLDNFDKKIWVYALEGATEMQRDYSNKNSWLHCEHCGFRFSFLILVIRKTGIKKGEKYNIKCPKCKKLSIKIKGVDPLNE